MQVFHKVKYSMLVAIPTLKHVFCLALSIATLK